MNEQKAKYQYAIVRWVDQGPDIVDDVIKEMIDRLQNREAVSPLSVLGLLAPASELIMQLQTARKQAGDDGPSGEDLAIKSGEGHTETVEKRAGWWPVNRGPSIDVNDPAVQQLLRAIVVATVDETLYEIERHSFGAKGVNDLAIRASTWRNTLDNGWVARVIKDALVEVGHPVPGGEGDDA